METCNREAELRQTLMVFRSTFLGRHAVNMRYLFKLSVARSWHEKTGAKLQMQASILQGRGEWGYKACSVCFFLMFAPILFIFANFKHLHKSWLNCMLVTKSTSYLSFLSEVQNTYSAEIFSPGEPSHVLKHTWKTFSSLHMICITCTSLNHEHSVAMWTITKTRPTSFWNI